MSEGKNRMDQKHISMELTADGARVTNLSLRGSRLILTIEAELADSQLRAGDVPGAATGNDAIATAFRPKANVDDPHKDTDFLGRPDSASASALGMAEPVAASGALTMGSENLPPAPAAAFGYGDPHSRPTPPEQITQSLDYPGLDATFAIKPDPFIPPPEPESESDLSDTHMLAFEQVFHEPSAVDFSSAPPAPPAEPVQELTEAWDSPAKPGASGLELDDPDATLPAPGLNLAARQAPFTPAFSPDLAPAAPQPFAGLGFAGTQAAPVPAPMSAPAPAPLSPEPLAEIKLGGDDLFTPAPNFTSSPAPSPAPGPVAPVELRLGGDDAYIPDGQPGSRVKPPATASAPLMESWDHGSISIGDMSQPFEGPASLAMTEDSSAIGGERHGEPLPAISFGTDPIAAPMPGLAPVFLNPEPTPAAAQPPAPKPAAPIEIGGLKLSSEPPAPAVTPASAPIGFDGPSFLGAPPSLSVPKAQEEATIQMDMREFAPQLATAPAKQPEPPRPEPAKAGEPAREDANNDKPEGGTTVLIRYTCPKCKTQGMQAVDKVGTVVNCANCGKAMRLVMKK